MLVEFNPPGTWMDKIDPYLLLRFWRKKGKPGFLVFHTPFGMDIHYFSTMFGEMSMKVDPTLYERRWQNEFKVDLLKDGLRNEYLLNQ